MDGHPITAQRLARGVCRALGALGYAALTEFPLNSGRRVDVIAVNGAGETVIVEIKTSTADYRCDRKWNEYLEFCDAFYFAVPTAFPLALLPADCGLMIADDYGAEILRRPAAQPLNSSRRRAQTLRLAFAAMQRLGRLIDPESGIQPHVCKKARPAPSSTTQVRRSLWNAPVSMPMRFGC